MSRIRLPRRRFLQAAGAGSVAVLATTPGIASAQGAPAPVFVHGVASGDHLPDRVMIWTRVTPEPAAVPGSGIGASVPVQWSVASDPEFRTIVASGSVSATTDSDHTVKIDVGGLRPSTGYWYRFEALGQTSRVGTTHTAPATEADVDRLRFGVVSCSNWAAGYFTAYRHMARRDDLDSVIHLGDYLYEYGRGGYGGRNGDVRLVDPPGEIMTLSDYRTRHGQYKTDPDAQDLHAKVPWIATWDDHESANDAYDTGAENHTPGVEGNWIDRRAAAMRAYLEWMPVRSGGTADDPHLYRRFRFGKLAELSMLDLRTYRSAQVSVLNGRGVDDPNRSITGPAQMSWLLDNLNTSSARWNVIGNPVMIGPLVFPPLEPATVKALTEVTGLPAEGLPANADQWDGYTADRRRVFETLAKRDHDTVFLTGDIHTSWCNELPLGTAEYYSGPVVGTEFVVTSVTSKNFDEILHMPPRTTSLAIEAAIQTFNQHVKYVELDSHGYGVFEVNAEAVQMDWHFVSDPADPNASEHLGASWRQPRGGRVAPAAPLG